jgi:hypothetical protein
MNTLHNFFRADFTQSAEYLLAVSLGPLSEDCATSFAAMLGEMDPTEEGKGNWVATGDGNYTLDEAEVIYVGNNHEDLPTHPGFKYAVGVRLRPNADGARRLYLQFNDPVTE